MSATLREHISQGRGHLLTEDVLRFETALELQRRGVEPARLRFEYPVPQLGGILDLVIDDPPSAVVEFKFPRDSRTGISPDTMTMGELVKDFYRIAKLAAGDGWVVQLIGERLRAYLQRRTEAAWTWEPGKTLTFAPETLHAMPRTALGMMPEWTRLMTVVASCVEAHPIGGATLVAYRIEPLG